MKQTILNFCLSQVKKNNPHLSENKIDVIRYGLEGAYLTLTKLIIILVITFILGIVVEFLLFCLFYNIVRCFAYGLHASNSFTCLIVSVVIFVLFPYLATILIIPFNLKIILGLLSLIIFFIYAPADTHKRPLVRRKRRLISKFISICLCILYIVIMILLENNFITNCLLFSLIVEAIFILPITYKIFGLPYNNYRNYQPRTVN